jgi:MFS family permease
MLSAVLIASVVNVPAIPLIALLSDRVGRRPVCLAGAVAAIGWAYPLFALIRTRSPLWITVSFIGGVVIATLIFTPMGAYLPELFETRLLYSGVAVSSNVAAMLGGGLDLLPTHDATAIADARSSLHLAATRPAHRLRRHRVEASQLRPVGAEPDVV